MRIMVIVAAVELFEVAAAAFVTMKMMMKAGHSHDSLYYSLRINGNAPTAVRHARAAAATATSPACAPVAAQASQ